MKYLMLFLLSLPLHANDCVHTHSRFNCVEYVKNYDGDTVTFNIAGVHSLIGSKINIRLNGVDTPEMRGRKACEKTKAKQAKALVSSILKDAKRIDLVNVKRGKYFRIVADIMVDGKSLSDALLARKLAVKYDGGRKPASNWCEP
jgi:micrococcal nuclease